MQLSYLSAAGFAPVEAIWSWNKFAVFYAEKPIVTVSADAEQMPFSEQ